MADVLSKYDIEADKHYRNRVYPSKVVRVTEIKDGQVTFFFVEGLREGYPRAGEPHRMWAREFARYYTDKL
jgi:hypothetical protein